MSPHTPLAVRAAKARLSRVARSAVPLRRRGSLSMASALPLITSGIVVAVLASALALTWLTLTRMAMDTARERVQRTTRQLKVLVDASMVNARARFAATAHDTVLQRVLVDPERALGDSLTRAALHKAMERLLIASDTVAHVELWSADGRLAYTYRGREMTPAVEPTDPDFLPPAAASLPPRRFGFDEIPRGDTMRVSALIECGGRACYWQLMPVRRDGRLLGLIAQYRQILINTRSDRALRELGGASLRIYYANADESLWTSVFGQLAERPGPEHNGVHYRPTVGDVVFAKYPIEGAPFRIAAEIPRDEILAPARAAVRRLAALSLFLVIAGVMVAWVFGRRLTRPLVELTEAAERVAAGSFDVRVNASGTTEVESLADSFNHMAEQVGASLAEVETASRAKSDFLATMSHELRTPLNAIGGYVELMEMGLRGPVSDLQRHDLARIRQSQAHLLSLISAVLDLSRFERGQVSYELGTLALHPFLAGLDALVAPQAAAKRLTLVYEAGDATLAVVADREKLRQVLLNLLSNAIRYTPPGGTITLGAEPLDGDTVAISVRDTGPGIAPERHEEIFEPFVQLDRSLTQSREGVGLGLAISRDLARGMGGRLYVDSEPGEGACFVVELPRGDIDEAPAFVTTAEMSAVLRPDVT